MMKIKNQKPIEIDAHFKYLCPKCNFDHWLFLRESKTKNYKIVCDCGTIFKPKLIESIKIKYSKKKKKTISPINNQVFNQVLKILMTYGFTKSEADKLVIEAYNKTLDNNAGSLVKHILANLGDTNE